MKNSSWKRRLMLLLGVIFIVLTVLQFPELFIKHRFDYKQFSIYAKDNIKLDHHVKSVLDSVISNLEKSDFHDPKLGMKLFFVHGSNYEKALRIFGRKNMAFSYFSRHIYAAYPDFKKSILYRNESKVARLNLAQIITHESVHSQMYPYYAPYFVMTGPSWVHEGYCEYISFDPVRSNELYNWTIEFERYQSEEGYWTLTHFGTYTPRAYFRDRLIVEYLIDQKDLNIKDIMIDKQLNVDQLLKEMNLIK